MKKSFLIENFDRIAVLFLVILILLAFKSPAVPQSQVQDSVVYSLVLWEQTQTEKKYFVFNSKTGLATHCVVFEKSGDFWQ